ncbi:uncharacterized protein F5Z01DRAFT_130725 [Emericellopsis atlantica]|uniref:2EXR domain-containing protein n=1 Tax=Emericellopsis atlantica TaxID=2614577 RepID=A0A9P8CP51_9HYPO|nr:uncharacterized protein F5Z01DRAFT_130725 [Emericellopsis atlantica]KAG9253827.1 hypothetical protein F5Z01DRAFT_130725 [Emericellopsis atlantica]
MSFSALPFELRMQIWELTVVPRLLHLKLKQFLCDCKAHGSKEHENRVWITCITTSAPAPPALQVCHESRTHLSRPRLYQRSLIPYNRKHVLGRYTWVNFNLDMLSIGTCQLLMLKSYSPLVQRLRFEREIGEWFLHFGGHNLGKFPNIKEIQVVGRHNLLAWKDSWEGLDWVCPRDKVSFVDPRNGMVMSGRQYDEWRYWVEYQAADCDSPDGPWQRGNQEYWVQEGWIIDTEHW